MSNGNNLPLELLLTTRQKTNLRNVFKNHVSTDIKLSKAQTSKIIQSGGILGSSLSKFSSPSTRVAVPLVKTILVPLGIAAVASPVVQELKKTWFWKYYFNNFKQRTE